MSRALVVDAHQHFWDPSRATYPWMTDELAPIRRPFGPEELRPELVRCGVDMTVLVQTRSSLEETRQFLEIAATSDIVAGVVGWVDLKDPALAETLAGLRGGPGGDRLVGVRHQVHDEPDPDWLRSREVRRGLVAVADAGLTYDLLVRAREMPAALDVTAELPQLRFVLDHIGKPAIRGGRDQLWEDRLAPLGRLSNVHCKLSGMVTEADWRVWQVEDLVPFVRQVRSWFGDRRLMFGSDWPVCLLAASYEQVVQALRLALGDIEPAALERVMGGNAIDFYGLKFDA